MPSSKFHYMRDYSKRRRHERKRWAINKFGSRCGKCSSVKKLQFDHIDRKTKKINVSEIWMYSWKTFLKELNKCQLLCYKCHLDKSRIDGSFKKRGKTKHGTSTAYVHHGCRCELCKKWKREYRKLRSSRQEVKVVSLQT